MTIKKCQVCGEDVKIDNYGNGKCKNCGWWQDENAILFPNAVNSPNFLSLNESKDYFIKKEKKIIYFQRVCELVDRGFDISFVYKNKRYQIDKHDNITLWEMGTKNFTTYENITKFKNTAKINNKMICDIGMK